MTDDGLGLDAGGTGMTAYADAVAVYLSFVVSSLADRIVADLHLVDMGGATWGTKTRNNICPPSNRDELEFCRG